MLNSLEKKKAKGALLLNPFFSKKKTKNSFKIICQVEFDFYQSRPEIDKD
jgi:hypothetical protein